MIVLLLILIVFKFIYLSNYGIKRGTIILSILILGLVLMVGCSKPATEEAKQDINEVNTNSDVPNENTVNKHNQESEENNELLNNEEADDRNFTVNNYININNKDTEEVNLLLNELLYLKENKMQLEKKIKIFYQENPRWSIQGEINNNDGDKLIIWGTAISSEAEPSHPGFLLEENNVLILNPDKSKIYYNKYAGGIHYFLGTEYGKGVLGQDVPVKVFGDAPAEVKRKENELVNSFTELDTKYSDGIENIATRTKDSYSNNENNKITYMNRADLAYEVANLLEKITGYDYDLLQYSVDQYERASVLDSIDKDLLMKIANIYYEMSYYDELHDTFTKLAELDPQYLISNIDENFLQCLAGQVFLDLNKSDSAVVVLSRYLQKHSNLSNEYIEVDSEEYLVITNLVRAHMNQAVFYSDSGDYTNEINSYEDAISVLNMINLPNDYTIQELTLHCNKNLSIAYQKSGDLASSDKYISESETIIGGRAVEYGDSTLNQQYISIGTSYVEEGNLKLGYEYYEKAIYNDLVDITFYNSITDPPIYQLNTMNPDAYYLTGLAYINKGGFELQHLALSYLEHAIELNNTDPRYYNAIGYYYRSFSNENADYEKSIEYLNKSIEVDPSYKRAYGNLYYIYLSGEYANYDKATEYSKKSQDENGFMVDGVETLEDF